MQSGWVSLTRRPDEGDDESAGHGTGARKTRHGRSVPRRRFCDPLAAALAAGTELTDRERSALGRIRPGALAAFQRYLGGSKSATGPRRLVRRAVSQSK